MTIKNLDTNDWRDVEMCLNARPREGYLYKISYLKSGDTAKVELNDFSKKDGTRFNFITTDITEIWIGGGGYDWTGKGKQ